MLEQHHQKVGYADLDPRVNEAMVINEDKCIVKNSNSLYRQQGVK